MTQLSVTTYCACKFEPIMLFLKVSFYEASFYKSSNLNNESDIFMIVTKMSFNKLSNYIKREVKKQHIIANIIFDSKNVLEFSIRGDIALNFDKLKHIIQYINETAA